MFHRVLVPLDGSADSESVLPQLQRPAMAEAEIFLLHVIPPVPLPAGTPPTVVLELPDHADAYLEGAVGKIPSHKVTKVVRAGEAADRILRVALELNIDLIALTTHGRGGLSRLLLGSVAESVVRESSLPVFLVRPGIPAPTRIVRRILTPVSGSERSVQVLRIVKPWAAERGAEIVLVHVVQPLVVSTDSMGSIATAPQVVAPGEPPPDILELPLILQREGYRARLSVRTGDPVSQILHEAQESDCDMIAMTTAGRSGLSRLLLGSVAEGVLRTSDRPVLLVRATEH